MTRHSEDEFLRWANDHGLALDPKYPKSAVLTYAGGPSEARFWRVPAEAQRRPHFLVSMLELMGDWEFCYVWRHLGSWPSEVDADRITDVVEHRIQSALGLPMGSTDVVEFASTDYATLVTLLFSTTIFGWHTGDDLYVVPNSARYLLQTDHHDVVHVEFRNVADLDPWVAEMESRGFPLPTDLPDATFKRPDWMPRHDR